MSRFSWFSHISTQQSIQYSCLWNSILYVNKLSVWVSSVLTNWVEIIYYLVRVVLPLLLYWLVLQPILDMQLVMTWQVSWSHVPLQCLSSGFGYWMLLTTCCRVHGRPFLQTYVPEIQISWVGPTHSFHFLWLLVISSGMLLVPIRSYTRFYCNLLSFCISVLNYIAILFDFLFIKKIIVIFKFHHISNLSYVTKMMEFCRKIYSVLVGRTVVWGPVIRRTLLF